VVSQADVEIVRGHYEAFNRGELEAFLSALDPEFEWNGPREIPDLAGPHYGPEGVRGYLSKLTEVFHNYRMLPEEIIALGDDRVLVLAREGGSGKGSGIAVQTNPTGHIWTLRNGKPARLESYWERSAALKAVGLEE
jgi:ketosteroid isomerase-like protein